MISVCVVIGGDEWWCATLTVVCNRLLQPGASSLRGTQTDRQDII